MNKNFLKKIKIFFLISLIPLIIFLVFVKKHTVGWGDDSSTQIFGSYYFEKHLFTWNDDYLGDKAYFSTLSWYFFHYLISSVSHSDLVANLSMLFIFQYYIPFLGMFYFIRKIFKLNTIYAVTGALFYVYNPFHLLMYFSSIYSPILSFFPFTFAIFINTLGKIKKYRSKDIIYYAFLISILILLAMPAIAHMAYTNVYLLMVFYFFYFVFCLLRKKQYKLIKKILFFVFSILIFSLLLNAYWIFNDLGRYISDMHRISGGALKTITFIDSVKLYEALRLLGYWAFRAKAYYDYYFPYNGYFFTPLAIFLTYALTFFIFLPILFIRGKNKKILFLYIFLFFVFVFATGSRTPGGDMFAYLYTHLGFFTIFRNTNKFNIIIVFIYPVLLAFGLKFLIEKIKNIKLKILCSILFFSALLYTIFPTMAAYSLNKRPKNGPMGLPYQKIPDYFFQLKQDLEKDDAVGRVLILPYYYDIASYWKLGCDQSKPVPFSIIKKPVLFLYPSTSLVEGTSVGDFFQYDALNKGIDFLSLEALKIFNIKYIVLMRDLDNRYKKERDPFYYYFDYKFFEEEINQADYINKVKDYFLLNRDYLDSLQNDIRAPKEIYDKIYDLENEYALSLYKVKDEDYLPIFYTPDVIVEAQDNFYKKEWSKEEKIVFINQEDLSPFLKNKVKEPLAENHSNIEYKKVVPYKYKIKLNNINASTVLSFSERFDKYWKLYPVKFSENKEGQVKFISKDFFASVQNDNIQSGNLFDTLLLKSLDDRYHFLSNYYTNAWYIDFDYLKKEFPEFLKENADGTFDVEFIVEYEKQNLSYLVSLFSLFVFLFMLGYIIYYKKYALKNN